MLPTDQIGDVFRNSWTPVSGVGSVDRVLVGFDRQLDVALRRPEVAGLQIQHEDIGALADGQHQDGGRSVDDHAGG